MQNQRLLKIACVVSIICLASFVSCAVPEGKGKNSQVPIINGTPLTPEMSDSQILLAFGIDPTKANSRIAKGPDGNSTTYSAGEQNVSITRSAVTGVAIMAWGPIKGDWLLGK